MKLNRFVAVAALVASPAFAGPIVDFEKTWDYSDGAVNGYYGGGTASDGSSGPNLGVTFTGVSGLSNDALTTYYAGAPSMLGVAYVFDSTAVMNIADGAQHLSFFYSALDLIPNAILAYSGLNGSGALLGSFDLLANPSGTGIYDKWDQKFLGFSGIAHSFVLGGSAFQNVAFDNFVVPEPETTPMVLLGLGLLGLLSRRRKQNTA